MAKPMNNELRQRTELYSEGFSGEMRLIPFWSIIGAVLASAGMLYVLWVIVPAHRHHPPNLPFWFRFYVNISISALAGL